MTEDIHLQEETKETSSPLEEQRQKQSPLVMIVLGLLVALFLGFGVYYSIVLHGVKTLSQSDFVLKSAELFHMPVARVNGVKLLYTDYVAQIDAMNTFYDTDDTGAERPSADDMSDYVLSRMMINELIFQAAQEFDVDVTQEELDTIVSEQVLPSFDSEQAAHDEILKRYGWDFDTFVHNIVYPTELERKVADAFVASSQDEAGDEALKAQAQEILEKIKNGEETFEDMAMQYGSDGTAQKGGDLGWFGHGLMVPEFEDAVFALEPGQLGDELVKTEFGYHIVQVDDRRTTKDEETGEDVEEIKARHILFQGTTTTIDDFPAFMNNRLENAAIEVLESVHNPFEDFLKQVEEDHQGDGVPDDAIDTTTEE